MVSGESESCCEGRTRKVPRTNQNFHPGEYRLHHFDSMGKGNFVDTWPENEKHSAWLDRNCPRFLLLLPCCRRSSIYNL